MEQRSFFLKTAVVLVFAFLWLILAQRLFPQFFPKRNAPPQQPAAVQPNAEPDAEGAEQEVAGEGVAAAPQVAEDQGEAAEPQDAAPQPQQPLKEHPHDSVELGSMDPDSGYFALVTLNTAGAAIESVKLNDPRYTQLDDRNEPLKIVGNDSKTNRRTLQAAIKQIDVQLAQHGTSLAEVDWEIVPGSRSEDEVTFRYPGPDNPIEAPIEIRKHYRLNPGDPEARDFDPTGYLLEFDLEIENLTADEQQLAYEIQGPVGLPLENEANSRAFIEIKAGTLEDVTAPNSISDVEQTASHVVDQFEENPNDLETWKSPLKYVGVDVQYFAALILPQGNQLQSRYFSAAEPVLLSKHPTNDAWSDVSVRLRSETMELEVGETVEHNFRVFFGPKRSDLLEPLGAGGVKDFGWFGIISRGMLAVLNFFHHTLLAPYGIAIIMLTVVVRACLFPVSRKMAVNQQRMKELQPKMQEIRTKYKDDQEKMAQAYREFMAKHGFNPLAGCLPMFLQLPIFFGLYQALYNSVDLRLAPFLWIDNLAAPDQLFPFGFALPLVGWRHFNLLPLLTVGLFVFQQKMFMPPPTSEEQEMQYKMMNWFTILIGFMFYRVPAGLCIYFIASSLWGICERKLLELTGATSAGQPAGGEVSDSEEDGRGGRAKAPGDSPEPKPPGLLQRLMEAADQAKNPATSNPAKQQQVRGQKGGTKRGRGRKSKPRR